MHINLRPVGPIRVLLLVLVCSLVPAAALPSAMATERNQDASAQEPMFVRGKPTILEAGPNRLQSFVPPAPDAPHRTRPASAMFDVQYEGFPDNAKAAFAYAVDLWSRQLTTSVPIRVRAVWSSFDRTSILAGAEPHMYVANFANAPHRNTLYPIALANKLAGYDLIPNGADAHDIDVYINGDRTDWSFRTDGNWENRSYDFVTLVMHELAHGFGFAGSMTADGTTAHWGGRGGFPEIYDRFTVDGAGQSLIDTARYPNPSRALRDQVTQKVLWNGPNGIAAAEGQRPELWAPSSWAEGSSYSHLTEYGSEEGPFSFRFDRLMTPYLDMEEVIHDPGGVTRGMLRDMGWTADYAPIPGVPTAQLAVFPAFTDHDHDVGLIRNDTTLFVTNYNGTATRLVVRADDAVVYDGPFTADQNRVMQVPVTLPGGETCKLVTLSAVLSNAEGASAPSTATINLDGAIQTTPSVTRPPLRPESSPAEGPLVGGDPAYLSSNTVRIRVPDEAVGCAGVRSYTMVYDTVPSGTVPAERSEILDFYGTIFEQDRTFVRRDGGIVPGTYSFHIDLADNLNNRKRFPTADGSFRLTIDTTPPTARIEGNPSSPSPVQPGWVSADLSRLVVTDDLYRNASTGNAYWGYWVMVTPTSVIPPSPEQWQASGVVVAGQPRSLLWRIPAPRAGQPIPAGGYRMWVRVLDGAGNASDEVIPILMPIDAPSSTYLPLVLR